MTIEEKFLNAKPMEEENNQIISESTKIEEMSFEEKREQTLIEFKEICNNFIEKILNDLVDEEDTSYKNDESYKDNFLDKLDEYLNSPLI